MCAISKAAARAARRALIERFYGELWDRGDLSVAGEILAPDFRFRGSLGPEKIGVDAFLEYVRLVRGALSGYRSDIEHMVQDGASVACRMTFSGDHIGPLFGVAATGKRISWPAAAFFEIPPGAPGVDRIAALWVLGDVDAVKRQLGAQGAETAP